MAQVEAAYRAEISQLEGASASEQQAAIQPFQERIATLSEKEYTLPPDSLLVELGTYDAEKQIFPVSIRNKQQAVAKAAVVKKTGKKVTVRQGQEPYVKVAMNGTIPLSREAARSFKQQWQAGAVRLEVVAKANTGAVQRIALVNDEDGAVRECLNGRCLTGAERERQEQERLQREREPLERAHGIYKDSQTGLQWLRDGNLAGKQMNWPEAMAWVQTLQFGGYRDWRLPTREEFEAFTKHAGYRRPSDYFNSNGFNNVQAMNYWSSTLKDEAMAWYVEVDYGNVSYGRKRAELYVWPVRGGKEDKPREIEGNI